MEYYLIQFQNLAGVVDNTLGFTLDSTVVQKELDLYDQTHGGHKGYSKEDHECPSCDGRIVITPIYPYGGM